jgi:hypothetical protein
MIIGYNDRYGKELSVRAINRGLSRVKSSIMNAALMPELLKCTSNF